MITVGNTINDKYCNVYRKVQLTQNFVSVYSTTIKQPKNNPFNRAPFPEGNLLKLALRCTKPNTKNPKDTKTNAVANIVKIVGGSTRFSGSLKIIWPFGSYEIAELWGTIDLTKLISFWERVFLILVERLSSAISTSNIYEPEYARIVC